MGEIESRTAPSTPRNGAGGNGSNGGGNEFGLMSEPVDPAPSLIALNPSRTKPTGKNGTEVREPVTPVDLSNDDGNDHFAKFLAFHRIVPEVEIAPALARVHQANRRLEGQALGASLLEELARSGNYQIDQLLASLIDATKFGYVPIEYYDIDRAVVRMLPESLTLRRLIIPFDIVSRTIMIALCNPFDAGAKQAVQSSLDYNIQWYLAKPSAIARILRDVYRLESRD
jgi:hypothetical protein